MKNKILVIVGPTASGKSSLAVRLAKKFNGEVISADSRQVYKGLNIGTGKITKREMRGVKHYLLDVVELKKRFSVSDFVLEANKALKVIEAKEALPIVVGGTGFYIDALAGKVVLPEVPPNMVLRNKLDKVNKEKLFKMLKKRDPQRAKNIDPNNKVRIIRALEIIEALGKVPLQAASSKLQAKFVYIGLKPEDLDKKIYKRLVKRIPGIIREAKKLLKLKKLSSKRMQELGLEYRFASLYLDKKLSKKEFIDQLYTAIRQYSKRQMTWFKRNKKIKWFTPEDYNNIEKYVKKLI
ncbi:tRNA (adenosine(37)-N6)-dimethylallyltransferase MiaA [Candidatus Parcubacteria bacterium]|nr:tRNA (adenosine(37)-N6)-dimethylallyltransferase MiaA [Candidatus Parcubacteria bacterium]